MEAKDGYCLSDVVQYHCYRNIYQQFTVVKLLDQAFVVALFLISGLLNGLKSLCILLSLVVGC